MEKAEALELVAAIDDLSRDPGKQIAVVDRKKSDDDRRNSGRTISPCSAAARTPATTPHLGVPHLGSGLQ